MQGRTRKGNQQSGIPRHPGRSAGARDRSQGCLLRGSVTTGIKTYQEQILKNAKALAGALMEEGFQLVSGGTDNHLMLVDLQNMGITGKELQRRLDEVYITVNKNAVPNDPASRL